MISVSLDHALRGQPWSLSALMFDLNAVLDTEGRPVSERRADAVVRAGVPMDMRLCPYTGPRHDRWMNASALVQVSNHYNAVMATFAQRRGELVAGAPRWPDILALVLDQLARPAVTLLQQRGRIDRVPADDAVAHKLAAGLFGVLRTVHERLAEGQQIDCSAAAFQQVVEATGALVGPAEVCAGSPQMIRRVGLWVVDGDNGAACTQPGAATEDDAAQAPLPVADAGRIATARSLALQVSLGIVWRLYDRAALWRLLQGPWRGALRPANDYLQRRLAQATLELSAQPPPQPQPGQWPHGLDPEAAQVLQRALAHQAPAAALAEDRAAVQALSAGGGGALRIAGEPAQAAALAEELVAYLHTLRSFQAVIAAQEAPVRAWLGYPAEAGVRLGHAALPLPQALHWYELMLGRRLGSDGRLSGSWIGRVPG